jgi:hypothetical protein
MKSFKVLVHNHRADFFKELMKCFDFVEIEEVESFSEPRVYPGANFEIRSSSSTSAANLNSMQFEKSNLKNATLSNEEKMENLRNALRQIEEQRNKSRS